ncbi:MAG: COX15/CtaA family protein [Pseudomonadota bacterium]
MIGSIDRGRTNARRAIARWLTVLGALVVLMIVVGGLTRLTDSGLSITEWAPIAGALPPFSDAAWEVEFEKYRQIPEYQLQNAGMTLAEFKVIYWWEWGHRQLGRIIGLVWAVGFLYFLIRGQIPAGWTRRLLLLGGLGGLQGAIGWWMVSSGLTGTMLDVASYRLAIHLGLAFIILGVIGRSIFELGQDARAVFSHRRVRDSGLFTLATVFMCFVFIQILFGALVSGIDAGEAYATWPLMGDGVLPPQMLAFDPWWVNFFENQGTVQFVHRTWAYVILALGLYVGLRAAKAPQKIVRKAWARVGMLLLLMIGIGVATVLLVAPLWIAITHQFVGVLLWLAIVRAHFYTGFPSDDAIARNA